MMQAAAQAKRKAGETGRETRMKSAFRTVNGWLSAMRGRALSVTRILLLR